MVRIHFFFVYDDLIGVLKLRRSVPPNGNGHNARLLPESHILYNLPISYLTCIIK